MRVSCHNFHLLSNCCITWLQAETPSRCTPFWCCDTSAKHGWPKHLSTQQGQWSHTGLHSCQAAHRFTKAAPETAPTLKLRCPLPSSVRFFCQLQCCTASAGAQLCPPSPKLTRSVSQKIRQKFTPQHSFPRRKHKKWPRSFLHMQLPPGQGREPGCRKPRFKSIFYLDIFGPIVASVLFQTIVLGRIYLLILKKREENICLPFLPPAFFEEREGREHEHIIHFAFKPTCPD